MTEKFAVLGAPISHSKSPELHLAAFKILGRQATYERVEIAAGLKQHVAGLGADWKGLSLTMPLKSEALDTANYLDPLAIASLSCNTLVRDGESWLGYNTDIFGLRKASGEHLGGTISILGTGATARSSLLAFEDHEPIIWGRDSDKAVALSAAHGGRYASLEEALAADLVVSTLPKGALEDVATSSYPGVLLDVTYSNKGNRPNFKSYISGLEMLLWQAVAQQRLFAGHQMAEALEGETAVVRAMRLAIGMGE